MREGREINLLRTHDTILRLRQYACRTSYCVRLLARWVIDAPELEAKILFGRHLHDEAQAATAFRTRLGELSENFDLRVVEPPLNEPWLLNAAFAEDTLHRLSALYARQKLRELADAKGHLDQLAPISDEPTARLLKEQVRTLERQIEEARGTCAMLHREFPDAFPRELEGLQTTLADVSPQALRERLRAPTRPARDQRLRVDGPVPDPSSNDLERPEVILALLHVNLTDLEIATIEACSRLILDFPMMPWEFVCDMARQCWDEARHAEVFRRRILELGGKIGAFRVTHTLWDMATDQPIEVRIALHQLIGEWTGVDGALYYTRLLDDHGLAETARLFEFVALDEINHVAFGNRWIRFLLGTDDAVATAHLHAEERRAAFGKSVGGPLTFPFHRWACERAGFSQIEIDRLEDRQRSKGSIFQ